MLLKNLVQRIPVFADVARAINARIAKFRFMSSPQYWERRYRKGGTSGAGSYGRLAHFKAEVLNEFVSRNAVQSVIEFGCGDGAQLSLASYPRYVGVDVAPAAIKLCRERFSDDTTKVFASTDDKIDSLHDLALSIDVVFHLVEDDFFHCYMDRLFSSARRFVIIYSSNCDSQQPEPHVRHWIFTRWVETYRPEWRLHEKIPNRYPYDAKKSGQTSFADFYVYTRPLESR
jgi:hypothetical protein